MTDPPFRFNLWHDPWIRVTRCDNGADAELGIGRLLAEAHTLVGLADPSPLVVAGTHRLLTAILQAIEAPQTLDAIEGLLIAGQFDQAKLDAFAQQHAARFGLFHPTAPFLQTGDVPLGGWRKPAKGQKHPWSDPKPVAVLFAELPTETSRTHYHHVTDESHRLCPACCARGLMTVPAFAMSAGRGYAPGINGEPPVYVFPAGVPLFNALTLSLTPPSYQPEGCDPIRASVAIWNGPVVVPKDTAVSAVGYLESLTFPARRVRLYPLDQPVECTLCGANALTTVSKVCYEMGLWLSEEMGQWEDPFIALGAPEGASRRDSSLKAIRLQEGKALWREYNALLLTQDHKVYRPKIVKQIGDLLERRDGVLNEDQQYRFRCIGLRNPSGKAIVNEWIDEAFDVPGAILNDLDAANAVEASLNFANQVAHVLRSTFNVHFRPERDKGKSKTSPGKPGLTHYESDIS